MDEAMAAMQGKIHALFAALDAVDANRTVLLRDRLAAAPLAARLRRGRTAQRRGQHRPRDRGGR